MKPVRRMLCRKWRHRKRPRSASLQRRHDCQTPKQSAYVNGKRPRCL